MKRQPNKPKSGRGHEQTAVTATGSEAQTAATVSPKRLWLFRLLALLLPVLILCGLEAGLRIAGYGYPTGFFSKLRMKNREFLVQNEKFSLRFFPPELARWPSSFIFEKEKPAGVCRIFIFGESAAMGDPQPAFGAARYMEVLLKNRFPERKFEVINTGVTAINSHVILPIARGCAAQKGDVWIIYMGNNEMVGPFGAATIFGVRAPPLWLVRLHVALQQSRVGQMCVSWSRHLGKKSKNTAWGGMQMFLQNQLPPADPRKENVYRNFESNLRNIIRAGLDSGARVILNSMSVNLKDCPPFASLGNSNLPPADRAQFEKFYGEGRAWEEKGSNVSATQSFEQAAKLDPKFAELQFRWAECLMRASNATARAHYQLACDADALPFRADSRINSIIRRTAGDFARRGLALADAESVLAEASEFGLPGQEVFFEHVHFSFRGNYLLGRLWAEQVASVLPNSKDSTAPNWASQAICERDLGLTSWNRGFVLESVIRRMQQPPLSSQFNNPVRLAAVQADLQVLRAQQDTNAVMRTGQELVDAIQRAPQDPFLQEGFANFLEAVGDRKQAADAYRKMLELLPHDFYGCLQLGRLLGEQGQFKEAQPILQRAVGLRPSVAEGWYELGNVRAAQGMFEDALGDYDRACQLRPQDGAYICYKGKVLAKLGRHAEAVAFYRRAIQLRPAYWEARFELGTELAGQNQIAEAVQEYTEVLRINPGHAATRVNLGVILVRLNRLDDAIQQFEEALRIEPANQAAKEYMAQVAAKRARTP